MAKKLLACLLCLLISLSAFVGCDVAGTSSTTATSSDTSSSTASLPSELDKELEEELKIDLSDDFKAMSALRKEFDYKTLKFITQASTRYEASNQYSNRAGVKKVGFFTLETQGGVEKAVVMMHRVEHYHENGEITSEGGDSYLFYSVDTKDISVKNFDDCEIIIGKNNFDFALSFESDNSFVMGSQSDYPYRLLEVKGQDKDNPLIVTGSPYVNGVEIYLKNLNDLFVTLSNKNGEQFMGVYNSKEKTLNTFGDVPISEEINAGGINRLKEGQPRVYISRKDGFALYNLESENPFTPYAVFTGEDLGETVTPIKGFDSDRNDENRFCSPVVTKDNRLGFFTFDYDGNKINSFITDLNVEKTIEFRGPTFVDNIAYFTYVTKEYLKSVHTKYAVDTRKGKDNTPAVKEVVELADDNMKLEDFDYSKDADGYPLILGDDIRIVVNNAGQIGGYVFAEVKYDAKTHDLSAYTTTRYKSLKNYITGKLYKTDDAIILEPNDLTQLPIPYDEFTDYSTPVKIKIDGGNVQKMWDYIQSLNLDYENVVISVPHLVLNRINGTLSYTVELSEIYNGSANEEERKNLALETLKNYGVMTDGVFTKDEYVRSPQFQATPFSMLHYEEINDVKQYIGWYRVYKEFDLIQKMSFANVSSLTSNFLRKITVGGEEFEQAVTKFFNVKIETLRESKYYDNESNTYTADFSRNSYDNASVITLYSLEQITIGDTMQISVYLQNKNKYCIVTVKFDKNGGYKYTDVRITSSENIFNYPEGFNGSKFN